MTSGRPIGYVGLGAMGGAMAAHLIGSGYRVSVYDIRGEAVQQLVEQGATSARSAADAARGAEVVITSLPTPAAVQTAALGEDGIVAGIGAGAVLIEMSTSDPATTLRIAHEVEGRGARMLDVPVGMGPDAAARGELTLMVGGDPEVVESVQDVLDTLSARCHYCGPLGHGHAMKLVNNLVSCSTNALVAEAMALGVKAGLDPAAMREVLSSTAADNWHLRNSYPQRVFVRDFTPRFKLAFAHKDLALAVAHARALGVPVALTEAALRLHEAALAVELGEEDQTAVVKVLEQDTGVPVQPAK